MTDNQENRKRAFFRDYVYPFQRKNEALIRRIVHGENIEKNITEFRALTSQSETQASFAFLSMLNIAKPDSFHFNSALYNMKININALFHDNPKHASEISRLYLDIIKDNKPAHSEIWGYIQTQEYVRSVAIDKPTDRLDGPSV